MCFCVFLWGDCDDLGVLVFPMRDCDVYCGVSDFLDCVLSVVPEGSYLCGIGGK